MSNELGRNGLSLCPKCQGTTNEVPDLKKPYGFCSPCQWFTHSLSKEHNASMIRLTGSLIMMKSLMDSMDEDVKAKRDWRKATRDIADNLLTKLGVEVNYEIKNRKLK